MSLSSYRRRVRRLEREINAAEDSINILDKTKYVLGNFIMFTVPLPDGTVVPEGSRIVKDFYPFMPREPEPRGFTAGYWRERITADPNDYGVRYDTPEPEHDNGVAEPEEDFDASGAPAEQPDEES